MREQVLGSILDELDGSAADIGASAIISLDGLAVASSLAQVMIKGESGYVILIYAGKEAVLTIIARKEAKLGLIFLGASRAAKGIAAAR